MPDVLGTKERPLRVAIVGSGPSGFYAAEALFGSEHTVLVDMFESMPVPFGLVRYGVAPDHAKIKNVIKVYQKTAAREGFAFLGNVNVGVDISIEELRAHYDAVILASGAQTDKRLGIPGEDLAGSFTATEFVAWYNGHPAYADRQFDLSHEVTVVIGVGNVAVDVASILCKTIDELQATDITQHALDVLAESKVKETHLVGRRGPVQAAFTPQEAKEFGELADCGPIVDRADLELNEASESELESNSRARKNFDIIKKYSELPKPKTSKRFIMHFCESPIELLGDDKVEKVILEKNELIGEPGKQKSKGTGVTTELECGAFFRSVGYRGVAMPGVPFHEAWGIIPNVEGRITENDAHVPGLYAVGWIKRGASGIIGTNKPCSIETVKNLFSDLPILEPCADPSRSSVLELLARRGTKIVSYADWQKIDVAEIEEGKAKGKLREKFVRVDDMLEAAGLK
jgi:ferredoxin--NADP+ reductase